jgi:hypothetical protein
MKNFIRNLRKIFFSFFFAFSRVQMGSAFFIRILISPGVIALADIWFWLRTFYEWMPFALNLCYFFSQRRNLRKIREVDSKTQVV